MKDFGAMMVQDHSAANDKQKPCTGKNITPPGTIGNDAQKDIDDLNKKTGMDFDKAYMNMMLSDHKKDIKSFQKAADLKDMDVRNFAVETLPTLQKHLIPQWRSQVKNKQDFEQPARSRERKTV